MTLSTLRLYGDVSALPSNLTTALFIDAGVNLPNEVSLMGDLTVTNFLNLANFALTVSGNVVTSGSNGRIQQTASGSDLTVAGDVTIDGPTMNGYMTNGTLSIGGNLTVIASQSTTSFYGTGTHTTRLVDGAGTQTIRFSNPSTNMQRFQDLTIANFGNTVSFASTVVVVGTLFADDVALDRPVAAASVLDVRGIATVTATGITRLPVRVSSTSAASLHTFNGVTFASMAAADVQLYLELPGGVNFSLIMPDMSFDSPTFTSSGAHSQTVRGSGGLSENFVVELTNPSPTSTNAVFLQGANTLVIWP